VTNVSTDIHEYLLRGSQNPKQLESIDLMVNVGADLVMIKACEKAVFSYNPLKAEQIRFYDLFTVLRKMLQPI